MASEAVKVIVRKLNTVERDRVNGVTESALRYKKSLKEQSCSVSEMKARGRTQKENI